MDPYNSKKSSIEFIGDNIGPQQIFVSQDSDHLNMNYLANLILCIVNYSRNSIICDKEPILRAIIEDLQALLTSLDFDYIYSHSVHQNICYIVEDKNDYMAKTIHEYYRQDIKRESKAAKFIRDWMQKFKIGDDFEIELYAGALYRFYVIENGKKMDLAGKGMGTAQLMTLILRLGLDINLYSSRYSKPIIIVEEPEQNLHPALQSQLADMFTQLYEDFGFQVIVETHSEYLIRKSQVIVAERYHSKESFNKNPFKVIYFPTDGMPYDMIYRRDGKFVNDFGRGFYDEAANLAFSIF